MFYFIIGRLFIENLLRNCQLNLSLLSGRLPNLILKLIIQTVSFKNESAFGNRILVIRLYYGLYHEFRIIGEDHFVRFKGETSDRSSF